MIDIIELKKRINSASKAGIDFLFGVDFELKRGFFIEHPLQQSKVLWRVGRWSNFTPKTVGKGSYFTPKPIPFECYAKKFDTVHMAIMHGDSFLTNLTLKTELNSDYELEEVLYRCNSKYAILLNDRFVCFSPETFIKIENSVISSNPMKGTINANIENAEDIILNDTKEIAEHYTIVDLIRSDLSRVAKNVKVERLRYIERLETSTEPILQVSSEISGELTTNFNQNLADLIFALLPAGSVSGAPKPSTVDLIAKAEGENRGYYCGVFGYFDGSNLDSAVMIRFIEKDKGKLYFRSGGGVTVNSTAQSEYNEIIQKIYLPFL